jgi:hypothetical protein
MPNNFRTEELLGFLRQPNLHLAETSRVYLKNHWPKATQYSCGSSGSLTVNILMNDLTFEAAGNLDTNRVMIFSESHQSCFVAACLAVAAFAVASAPNESYFGDRQSQRGESLTERIVADATVTICKAGARSPSSERASLKLLFI